MSFLTPLVISPLSNGRQWRLVERFQYDVGWKGSGVVVCVEAGFISDLTTTFIPIWKWGDHGKAAIIHDKLCDDGIMYDMNHGEPIKIKVGRKVADQIFLEAMEVSGVSKPKRYLFYAAVRTWALASGRWD